MNEIEVQEIHTAKGVFGLKVYEDAERSDYLGKIDGPTPTFAQEPGHLVAIVAEGYRDQNKDELIERCKKRITELGGKITVCRNARITPLRRSR
jgi:hypothetical protein